MMQQRSDYLDWLKVGLELFRSIRWRRRKPSMFNGLSREGFFLATRHRTATVRER